MKRLMIFVISLAILFVTLITVDVSAQFGLIVFVCFMNYVILPILIARDANSRGYTRAEYVTLIIASVLFGFIAGFFYSFFVTFGEKIASVRNATTVKTKSPAAVTFYNVIIFFASLPALFAVLVLIAYVVNLPILGILNVIAMAMMYTGPVWSLPVLVVLVINLLTTYVDVRSNHLPWYSVFKKSRLILLYTIVVGPFILSAVWGHFVEVSQRSREEAVREKANMLFPVPSCYMESDSICSPEENKAIEDRRLFIDRALGR